MSNGSGDYVERASEHWRDGQPLEAGRLLYEQLSPQARAKWASRILQLVIQRSGLQVSAIEHIIRIANDTTKWSEAHRAFSKLRKSTFDLESLYSQSVKQELLLHHLYLAENVAKVIYNSTDPMDEFDEDSGWWVVVCLRGLVDWWNDGVFSEAAWVTLCSQVEDAP